MTAKTSLLAYLSGRITEDEMNRYQELRNKLMGNYSFIESKSTGEWKEFNKLNEKIFG